MGIGNDCMLILTFWAIPRKHGHGKKMENLLHFCNWCDKFGMKWKRVTYKTNSFICDIFQLNQMLVISCNFEKEQNAHISIAFKFMLLLYLFSVLFGWTCLTRVLFFFFFYIQNVIWVFLTNEFYYFSNNCFWLDKL